MAKSGEDETRISTFTPLFPLMLAYIDPECKHDFILYGEGEGLNDLSTNVRYPTKKTFVSTFTTLFPLMLAYIAPECKHDFILYGEEGEGGLKDLSTNVIYPTKKTFVEGLPIFMILHFCINVLHHHIFQRGYSSQQTLVDVTGPT